MRVTEGIGNVSADLHIKPVNSLIDLRSQYKLTKVVIIYPRFLIKNTTSVSLRIRETGSSKPLTVESGAREPLFKLRNPMEPQLVVGCPGVNNQWYETLSSLHRTRAAHADSLRTRTAPFKISDVGRIHVRLRLPNTDEDTLLRADIVLQSATIHVRFERESGPWPFLLRNLSSVDVQFCQTVSRADATEVLRLPLTQNRIPRTRPTRKKLGQTVRCIPYVLAPSSSTPGTIQPRPTSV